jgi:hypothetical protein
MRSPLRFVALAGVALTFAFSPTWAQREWHNSDGPYQGLRCAADETVVPILQGVKCQKLPHCGAGETMMPGPSGLECQRVESQVPTPGPMPVQEEAPTGAIPAIHADITGLRFFEGWNPPKVHHYDDLFFYNAARIIYWEIHLAHPAPGRRASFTLEDVWRDPSGAVVNRATRTFTIEPDWDYSYFYAGARLVDLKTVQTQNPLYSSCLDAQRREQERGASFLSCSPTTGVDIANWPEGTYQVDIYVDKKRAATGWFMMLAKDAIYDEVGRKIADRSRPSNTVPGLDAKVAALNFFAAGATVPARRERQFATRFASTQNIYWELDLKHAAPGRWLPLPIEALLFREDASGEQAVQRKVLQSAIPAGWSDTNHVDSFVWDDDYYYLRTGATTKSPRAWLPGTYRLDLYVADRKIASESFEIR